MRTEFAMELAAARLEIEINVAGWGWRGGGRQLSSPTASSCISHKPLKSSISRRLNPLDLPFLSPHNELFTFNYPASGVAQSQDIVARAQQHTHTFTYTRTKKKNPPLCRKQMPPAFLFEVPLTMSSSHHFPMCEEVPANKTSIKLTDKTNYKANRALMCHRS